MELQFQVAAVDDEATTAEFERLQKKLVPLWRSIQEMNHDPQTIVVVPSLSVDYPLAGTKLQAYEERFLFLLLLLRQPRARLIYVTSQTILPTVIEYYLGLLPGVIPAHARKRLFTLAPEDGSPQPLSVKLLNRPQLLGQIRDLIPNPDRAHLVPFNTTSYERELALQLGIPMYGADPRLMHFGTKSGCRKLFTETDVPHPAGFEELTSLEDLVDAVRDLRLQRPKARKAMVKHNDGVSGEGNAVIDLVDLDASVREAVEARVRSMKLEATSMDVGTYLDKFVAHGGIVEERVEGDEIRSPSVQLRVTPLGEVQLLSTHDQMLGGPSGQVYLGCRFPAAEPYAAAISREALKVGERLRDEGVLGRFAIDFIVAKTSDRWDLYAIEVNLRKGGTTHPFLTLQFLTDGRYDPEEAVFITPNGTKKCFVASDHVESPLYRVFRPDDVLDFAVLHGMHFDQTRQTGVVLHMMRALGEHGMTGLTAVGNSHDEAQALFERMVDILDREAEAALGMGAERAV